MWWWVSCLFVMYSLSDFSWSGIKGRINLPMCTKSKWEVVQESSHSKSCEWEDYLMGRHNVRNPHSLFSFFPSPAPRQFPLLMLQFCGSCDHAGTQNTGILLWDTGILSDQRNCGIKSFRRRSLSFPSLSFCNLDTAKPSLKNWQQNGNKALAY